MRSRQFRSLVVSILLAFMLSLPAMAAPRDREGWLDRDLSFVSKVLKVLKKTFGVGTTSDGLTLPTP